jgi:FkbM family methyltransferase
MPVITDEEPVALRASIKRLASRWVRSLSPSLWQRMKYRQYLSDGEREIHLVHRFIDPRRAALDIGVYLGVYTRHLAKFATEVIGFEANPDTADFATRSLRGLARIEWAALSSEPGTAVLRIPLVGQSAESSLGTVSQTNTLGGLFYHEISVPAKRLDDFDLPPVGFIKIDVEGHEEAVLAGGKRLLERDRPACMIEIEERHNPNALARIIHQFAAARYRALFYDGLALRGIAEFNANVHQVPGKQPYINNFFFLPSEAALGGKEEGGTDEESPRQGGLDRSRLLNLYVCRLRLNIPDFPIAPLERLAFQPRV